MPYKITVILLLVAAAACPAQAQLTADVALEDAAFAEAVRNYHEQLTLRSDPSAHREAVTDFLNDYDGRVIVEGFFGGEFHMMLWDAGLGNVVILRSGEEIPLDTHVDEYGRPAFEADAVSGWVDVSGNGLHVELMVMGEGVHRWLGEVPSAADKVGPLVGAHVDEYICTCGKTRETEQCDDQFDCTNKVPCTLSGGAQMKCEWRKKFKKEEYNPGHCAAGATGLPVPAGIALMGAVTFCGPVRRRAVRLIRR